MPPAPAVPPAELRHAVVTGSSGFIGKRLVDRLQTAGVQVTGLSRSSGFDLLEHEIPTAGIDHVYHVAGLTYVPKAWADPVSFHLANSHGTVRLLDQCRRANLPLTYVSAYVYGQPERLPISESTPARPNNPYACSKFAGEEACRFFASTFGVKATILRLFNVYGAGQDSTFLIPTIARQAIDPAVAEIVVADLRPRRDFVHVDDVVDALMAAPHLPRGQTFNVGSGRSWSVEDVITTSLVAAGSTKSYRDRGEYRANEILDVIADISALKMACGWEPTTSFERGIHSVIAAIKS